MASTASGRIRRLIFTAVLAAGIGAGATGVALAATSGAYTRTRAASFADTSSTGFAVGGQPLRQRPASARVDIRDIPRPSMLEGFVS